MSAVLREENFIHPTAVVVEPPVMGKGNYIGPHCYIGPDVKMGDNNTFTSHVCIGSPGQYRGKVSEGGVRIGSNNEFREFSQVHLGIAPEENTIIGSDGYFMAGAHIAHGCVIEDGVTMCNNATLGGDVRVMQGATLGFGAIVHQKQVIGSYSMLGMGSIVPKGAAIEPGRKYAGNPVEDLGRNLHALKKGQIRDLSDEVVRFYSLKETEQSSDPITALSAYMKTRSRQFQAGRYDLAKQVLPDLPYMDADEAANVYNMTFSLLWQQHEDFQADQIFIRELLIDQMTGGSIPPASTKPEGKIAWLINHCATGTYAPFKHVYAYLSGMQPCEVFVYGSVREKEAQELLTMGHNVHHIQGPPSGIVDKVQELCRTLEIGALITEIYLAPSLMAFMRRVAPLQVYLSPGFQLFPADLVLLPETQERIRDEARTPETKWAPIPTAICPEHLYRPVARKKAGRVFGCLSRAEKCSADYLRAVQSILDACEGAEFHFYGRGELDIEDPRFVKKGIHNAHEALGQIDVYLDTFPSCSGLSAYEAMAHGVPVVTLEHPSTASWNFVKPCVVQTEEEYRAKALAALGAERSTIAEQGKANAEKYLTDIPGAVSSLYSALRNAGWRP